MGIGALERLSASRDSDTVGVADESIGEQQEVARQSDALLAGLRRALRLKNTGRAWCRNEGHVGEMSDGADWIDVAKWGSAVEELLCGEKDGACCEAATRLRFEGDAEELESVENQR